MEWLTNELEEKAWEYLKKIEDKGGLVACIESGWVHQEFARAQMDYESAKKNGEKKIVGVNCYTMNHEPYQIPIFYPNPENMVEIQKEKIEKLKKERDSKKLETALEKLRSVTEKDENVMPTVIQVVKTGATLGEICNVWRGIYGIWEIPFKG